MSLVYIDDSFLQGNNYQDYFSNVLNTIEILRSLGLTFHADKSKCVPTYCITYLRFISNSLHMTFILTLSKK